MNRAPRNRAWLPTALLAAALPLAGAQEIYKSTDAQGHVVYSDHPTPSGSQRVPVDVIQGDPSEAARLEKLKAVENAEYAQRSREQAEQERQQAAQAKQDADRCKAARTRYLNLKDIRRLYRLDADGNRVYYTDEQVDAMRAQSQQAMDQACGKQTP